MRGQGRDLVVGGVGHAVWKQGFDHRAGEEAARAETLRRRRATSLERGADENREARDRGRQTGVRALRARRRAARRGCAASWVVRGLEPDEGMLFRPAGSIHMLFMRFAIDAVFCDRDLDGDRRGAAVSRPGATAGRTRREGRDRAGRGRRRRPARWRPTRARYASSS